MEKIFSSNTTFRVVNIAQNCEIVTLSTLVLPKMNPQDSIQN